MKAIPDHGTGDGRQKISGGEVGIRSTLNRDHTATTAHPILIELVRLLACQAAAEFLAASYPQAGMGGPS